MSDYTRSNFGADEQLAKGAAHRQPDANEALASMADNRPESIAQRRLQRSIDHAAPTGSAIVQRVVAAGLAAGTHVVINAGNQAGTVVTIHHENANFHGNHVYFVNIPGFGMPVPLLLNELDPHNMAAAAA